MDPQHWLPGPDKAFRTTKTNIKSMHSCKVPPKISGCPSQIIKAFDYGCSSQEFETVLRIRIHRNGSTCFWASWIRI